MILFSAVSIIVCNINISFFSPLQQLFIFILTKHFSAKLQMQESVFFFKFDKFKNYDTLKYVNQNENSLSSNIENLKQVIDPTRSQEMQKEKYQTRSIKIVADPHNISFEQNFMEEHKSCFHKQLQKYMEHQSSLIEGEGGERFRNRSYGYESDMSSMWNLTQMVREYGSSMSEQQKEMLIIDLKRQDKMSEFLEYVLNRVKDDSIEDVIHLANQIWEEFILIQDMNYSYQETIEFAEVFVSKHLERLDQKLSNINFKSLHNPNYRKNDSSQTKQRLNLFKKFLTFFTTSVCLVIGGYFQNPYSQTEQNYFKRESKQEFLQGNYEDEDFQSQDDEVIISKRVKS